MLFVNRLKHANVLGVLSGSLVKISELAAATLIWWWFQEKHVHRSGNGEHVKINKGSIETQIHRATKQNKLTSLSRQRR